LEVGNQELAKLVVTSEPIYNGGNVGASRSARRETPSQIGDVALEAA